jgi:uncharacterized membrane protein YkoI
MKLPQACWLILVGAFFISCASDKEAQLASQAKISKPEAAKIALAQAPNGSIQQGELEKEKGRLIWSFDIATPDSKNVTEVQIDAQSGQVVSIEKESPKQEAKEK